VGAELMLVFSMANVLYRGIGIPLSPPVKNTNYQDFLASYDHPFFRGAIRFSAPPARTLFECVPEEYHGAIKKAAEILKNEGASEVYLFGGMVSDKVKEKDSIDIAVSGLPQEAIERAYKKIEKAVNTKVSLFDMENGRQFFSFLKPNGLMVKLD
jgi:predicted nucleotidyltransferase